MPLLVPKLAVRPDAVWRVPGSKSLTNRAVLLAALADGVSVLEGCLESDDTAHMRGGLEAMGVAIEADGSTLTVHGVGRELAVPGDAIFVGNSGTTVRFLAAISALAKGGSITFVGDEHMARRPIDDLVDGLTQLGVAVQCPSGAPPLTVTGAGAIEGGITVRVRGDRSSQYLSGLLMALPLADKRVDIEIISPLVSRPYVDMTIAVMRRFGAVVSEPASNVFRIEPIAAYRAGRHVIEPDASAACYPFALAVATGGRITVPELGLETVQGDYRFLEVLEAMGASVERTNTNTVVSGPSDAVGVDVDLHDESDQVMTLAALAPLAKGPTTIRNVANIRIKETDRLAATAAELDRLGQHVETGDDWLRIEPRPLRTATVKTYGDHRMAMSFAVLGAATGAVTIDDPSCVSKTYPEFFADLAAVAGTAPRNIG